MAMLSLNTSVDVPTGLFVNGAWITESSGGTGEHVNAATGRVQHEFVLGGPVEMDAAVAAARAGLAEFRRWSATERRDVMLRIASALRERADELATLATLETGTLLSTNLGIGQLAASWFDYYAGWADKLTGAVHPVAGSLDYTLVEPIGVVGIIVSYNGPLGSIGMKLAPALAAGCSVVLKPPELAPFTSQVFAEICQSVGLPAGVVNVVPGGPDAGDALVRNPDVDKISFTGGTQTARKIQAACAENLTELVLELGGKSANLIFPDADLDTAIPASTTQIVARSGQSCVTPSRLLVHESLYDEVADRIATLFDEVRLGDPLDLESQMGPVIGSGACARIEGIIREATENSDAELLAGGSRADGELADGFFIRPTLFGDVANDSHLARTEVFGPVLAMMKFSDEDEAIALANDTDYGLAAYIHSRDVSRIQRVASRLEAGNVGVNGGGGMAGPIAPFGGIKRSGHGKEGGELGVLEFVRHKNINIALG